jgi:hypothetical protein
MRLDAMARRAEKIGEELTRKTASRIAGERNSIMTRSPNGATQVAKADHLTIAAQESRQVTRALRFLRICNALFPRLRGNPRRPEQAARYTR